jgi:hypothetical protein
MSRVAAGQTIEIAPRNDVYTALVVIAVVAELIALALLFLKYGDAFPGSLFAPG